MGDDSNKLNEENEPHQDPKSASHDELLRETMDSPELDEGLTKKDREAIASQPVEPGGDDYLRAIDADNRAARDRDLERQDEAWRQREAVDGSAAAEHDGDPNWPQPVSPHLALPIEVTPETTEDADAQLSAAESENGEWAPWLKKVVVPLVAVGAITGGTLFVVNNGSPAETSDQSPPGEETPAEDDEPGVTSLVLETCQSVTEGCDDKGDVAIDGEPFAEVARGADVSFASSGYAVDADQGRGEQQIQLSFAGNASGVSASPNTASYEIRLTGSSAGEEFMLTLRWSQGGPVDADLVTVDGTFVDDPVFTAEWTNDNALWVTFQGTGVARPADSVSIDVMAEVLNADGTPGAVVTDRAGA